jgi:putative hydrolase of the HAD superfamily
MFAVSQWHNVLRARLNVRQSLNYTPRALNARVSSVIFDFGGVLGLPQDPVTAANMAALCTLSIEEFWRLYYRDRAELDRGSLSTEEYWSRIMRAAGVLPEPDLIARIEEEDSRGWTRINRRVVEWAAELRAAGYTTAILSNMPFDKLVWMRKSKTFDWMDDFPVAVFSCDHRLVKPEPAFYRLCLELLEKEPEECLFLDDVPANVEGARAVGIPSLVFRSAEEAAPVLSGTWGLPVSSLRPS